MRAKSLVVSILLCMTAALPVDGLQGSRAIELEPHRFKTFDGREHEAELGHLTVPESRRSPGGRAIRLAFVRLRSRATAPAAPIFFLSGGPGVPATTLAQVPVYFALFDRLRDLSDVVLLDQRGSGLSTPNLVCPPMALPPDAFESEAKAVAALAASARSCAERWKGEGVDLRAYTTAESAGDVADLATALGAKRVSLLAWSYGTELALDVLRRHGDRVDRVVLAATRGPDRLLKLPATWDLQLRRLSRLAAGPVAGEGSDLAALLADAKVRLQKTPARVTAFDRATGRSVDLTVGAVGLEIVLRGLLNDGRAMTAVPALVTTAARGDYDLLGAFAGQMYGSVSKGLSAMQLAIDCSSGWSADRRARADREGRDALFGSVNLQWDPTVCGSVVDADGGAGFRGRVWSEAPTLFISGTLDGNSPAFEAEEVRWGFPNSTHLVVENAGHEALPAAEVQEAVLGFFAGRGGAARDLSLPAPKFLSIEEAKARFVQVPPGAPTR